MTRDRDYTPFAAVQNEVFEILRDRTGAVSDQDLAVILDEHLATLSRIRRGKQGLGPMLAFRIVEIPNLMDAAELRQLLGPDHPLNKRRRREDE